MIWCKLLKTKRKKGESVFSNINWPWVWIVVKNIIIFALGNLLYAPICTGLSNYEDNFLQGTYRSPKIVLNWSRNQHTGICFKESNKAGGDNMLLSSPEYLPTFTIVSRKSKAKSLWYLWEKFLAKDKILDIEPMIHKSGSLW